MPTGNMLIIFAHGLKTKILRLPLKKSGNIKKPLKWSKLNKKGVLRTDSKDTANILKISFIKFSRKRVQKPLQTYN